MFNKTMNVDKILLSVRDMKDIFQVQRTRLSWNNSMDLVSPVIFLTECELLKVAGDVVRGTTVSVPGSISTIGVGSVHQLLVGDVVFIKPMPAFRGNMASLEAHLAARALLGVVGVARVAVVGLLVGVAVGSTTTMTIAVAAKVTMTTTLVVDRRTVEATSTSSVGRVDRRVLSQSLKAVSRVLQEK